MTTLAKLSLLSSLYLSQGLPYGFFTQALPTFLRERQMSLALIGASSLLTMPWALKFLWAPLVDRYGSPAFGRRRSWIVPLQLAAIANLALLTAIDPARDLWIMCAAVILTNLLAATQDIATDAFAVDLLEPSERGLANGIQVAGYRVGMVIGGGLMLVVLHDHGWAPTFLGMAAMLALATVPILFHRERPPTGHAFEKIELSAFLEVVRAPEMRAWLAVLVIYKLGDYLGTGMLKPMLVDLGLSMADIGMLMGVVGCIAGLVGALLGGWGAERLGRRRALIVFGALQTASVLFYIVPALGHRSWLVLNVTCVLEHLTSGMATVTLFTMMMDRCRPQTAATDYTVQASVVVMASGLASALSGISAQKLGYPLHFAFASFVSLAGLVAIARLLKSVPKTAAEIGG